MAKITFKRDELPELIAYANDALKNPDSTGLSVVSEDDERVRSNEERKEVVNPFYREDVVFDVEKKDFVPGTSYFSKAIPFLQQHKVEESRNASNIRKYEVVPSLFKSRVNYVIDQFDYYINHIKDGIIFNRSAPSLRHTIFNIMPNIFEVHCMANCYKGNEMSNELFEMAIAICANLYTESTSLLLYNGNNTNPTVTNEDLYNWYNNLTPALYHMLSYLSFEAATVYKPLRDNTAYTEYLESQLDESIEF
jgi:hypothetical protein